MAASRSPVAHLTARQIPLRERPSWLRAIAAPAFEFVRRRFLLRLVERVQFREENRQRRIRRVMIDKVLEHIVALRGRPGLQMGVGDSQQRRDQERMRNAFGTMQNCGPGIDRALVIALREMNAAEEKAVLVAIADLRWLHLAKNAIGASAVAAIDEKVGRA